MKGYKVTNAERVRLVGVACSSLKELKTKSCQKFNLPHNVIVQLENGTFVEDEDYFQTLPQQTLLLVLKPGETALTGVDIALNALRSLNMEFLRAGEQARHFLMNNLTSQMLKIVGAHCCTDITTTKYMNKHILENINDDPDWFSGLDTRATTKSQVLNRNARDRIKGYFYKTKDAIMKSKQYMSNKQVRDKLAKTISDLALELKSQEYHGYYFDRKSTLKRLCSEAGQFKCRGKWNVKSCTYDSHIINPYVSKEERVLFQTWNLDHRIERSRTIVPTILKAADLAVEKTRDVNSLYFYNLLFSQENLKLVHIVCHDKKSHEITCDSKKYLIAAPNNLSFMHNTNAQKVY